MAKVDLGNFLGGILGDFGNIEELLNIADRLADAKEDAEAKEKVKRMREGLGKTEGKADFGTMKSQGLGGLFSQILNFVEKAGGTEETREFEIGGKKGVIVISRGIRTGGLGGEVRRHEPQTRRTQKPIVEEKVQEPALDVFEEENHIKVVGDMPGVSEENIKCEVVGRILRIYTETGRRYEKEIELPSAVTKKVDLKYRNGVLEVTLTK